jgi:hypothetical protein
VKDEELEGASQGVAEDDARLELKKGRIGSIQVWEVDEF